MKKKTGKSRAGKQLRQINFLIPGVVFHRIQQFECVGSDIKGRRSQECPVHKKPSENWTVKDYRNLLKNKTNVSWLSPEDVFLKVIHLPGESPDELRMMVELQLEKLSPVPLTQLIWDIQVLPNPAQLPAPEKDPEHPDEEVKPMLLYSVVVLMAERSTVESQLAILEESDFYADRIEVPFLYEILKNPETRDGLYLYPIRCEGKDIVICTWWTTGQLQSIDMIFLPADETWKTALPAQLTQVVWAGQVEGWLSENISWTLVPPAEDGETLPVPLSDWVELLTDLFGEGQTASRRMSSSELTNLNCSLICSGTPTANLIPPEFSASYRQKYVDKLWIQGIAAAVIAYFLFCFIYFSGATVAGFQKSRAEAKVQLLDSDFKTALKLKNQLEIFQVQKSLKSAALDCYRLTAENLPTELKLVRLNFSGGNELSFVGEAPSDQNDQVNAFNESLIRAMTYDEKPVPFFKKVATPNSSAKPGAGGTLTWRFSCELNLPELNTTTPKKK